MSEDVARAVGAGTLETITIAGKSCSPRPLSVKELTEVERECVRSFRKAYLQALKDDQEIFPLPQDILEARVDECKKWTISDLPARHVFDPSKIRVTKELRNWLIENWDDTITNEIEDTKLKAAAATVLDMGLLKEEQYKNLTHYSPRKVAVGYVNWWITGSLEGMMALVWACFKDQNITKEEFESSLNISNQGLLAQMAREIEHLSAPESKNG